MFESIKLRIIKGRKLKPFVVAKVLQEHEDRLNALEGNDGSSSEEPETPQEEPQLTKRNISFLIKDRDGEQDFDAVEGAVVTIDDITGTTGSAGGCTLQNVPDGERSVTVTAKGYPTKTETITVSENNTSFLILIG